MYANQEEIEANRRNPKNRFLLLFQVKLMIIGDINGLLNAELLFFQYWLEFGQSLILFLYQGWYQKKENGLPFGV